MSVTARAIIALITCLGICGLILSEALILLQQLMPMRAHSFLVAVAILWLFLDGLVTALDLHSAVARDTATPEREHLLLQRVEFASKRINILQTRLENEISLHIETAMALDSAEEKLHTRNKTISTLKQSVSDSDIHRTQRGWEITPIRI